MAAILVRNAVDHDSRVLRQARTMRALGIDATVLGVVSFTERREVTEHDGVVVRRISPSSRLTWAVYREISSLRPARTGRPATGRDGRAARRRVVRDAPGKASATPRTVTGPARRAVRRTLRWLTTLAYYRAAAAEVLRLRPDLVHCNDYNTMWVGVAARLLVGSRVIYDSHELWPDRNMRPEARWWLLLCEAVFVRVADRVVMTSPAHAETMARRYRIAEPLVVRNIPELRANGAGRPDRRSGSPDGRLAVYVGGLQPGRGIEQAIRALPLAEGVRLRLLGPGGPEYRAGIEGLVHSLGLERRVELAEPVPPDRVLDALGEADVGLALFQPTSLSHRLVLPNKLFEYALAGVPIVGSDLPMIARFIDEHGLGKAVDPEDVEQIARALEEVLQPERNRELRAAAERARAVLDGSRELELLADVYREALSRATGSANGR